MEHYHSFTWLPFLGSNISVSSVPSSLQSQIVWAVEKKNNSTWHLDHHRGSNVSTSFSRIPTDIERTGGTEKVKNISTSLLALDPNLAIIRLSLRVTLVLIQPYNVAWKIHGTLLSHRLHRSFTRDHASYGCLPPPAAVPCGCPALDPLLAAGCVWWACVAELPPAVPPDRTGAGAAGHLGGNGEITEAATAAACWLASTAAATHTERQQAINVFVTITLEHLLNARVCFPAVAVASLFGRWRPAALGNEIEHDSRTKKGETKILH